MALTTLKRRLLRSALLSILLLLDAFLPGNQLVASLWIKLLGDKGFLASTKTANTFLLKHASDFLEHRLPLLENDLNPAA